MKIMAEIAGRLTGHRDALYALATADVPGAFFSAGGDGLLVRWDTRQPQPVGDAVARLSQAIYSLQYLAGNEVLLAGTRFGQVFAFDLKTRKEKAFAQLEGDVFGMVYMPEVECLAAVTGEGYFYLLNANTLEVRHKVQVSEKSGRCISLSPEGDTLATGWSDSAIRLFDVQTRKERLLEIGHQPSVFALQYDLEGNRLWSGGRDAHIRIWDPMTLERDTALPAHLFTVNHLALNPSGRLMASASRDKSVKIWDVNNATLIKVLDRTRYAAHTHSVNTVLWLNDTTLVSGSDDKQLLIWQLKPE